MSSPQETRVGKKRRTRKAPTIFADQQFEGNYKRPKNTDNTEAGKNILAAAQVTEVEKSPTFVGLHAEFERTFCLGRKS